MRLDRPITGRQLWYSCARIYLPVYYDLTFKFAGSTLHTTAWQCCSNFLGTFYLTCSTVNITLNNIEHHFSLNWTLAHSDTATPQSPLVETSVERNQPEKCHLSVVWKALQSSIVKDNHNLDANEGHTYMWRGTTPERCDLCPLYAALWPWRKFL